jgi:hypothetical protein
VSLHDALVGWNGLNRFDRAQDKLRQRLNGLNVFSVGLN